MLFVQKDFLIEINILNQIYFLQVPIEYPLFQKGNRRYNKYWEIKFGWVTEYPKGSGQPYCKICNKYMQCKSHNLKKHEESKNHLRNVI